MGLFRHSSRVTIVAFATFCLFVQAAGAQSPTTQPKKVSVYKDKVTPNWIDNSRFWYANEVANGREYLLVDTANATREPLFDTNRLAAALSAAGAQPMDAAQVSIDEIAFEGGKWKLTVGGSVWVVDRDSYVAKNESEATTKPAATAPTTRRRRVRGNDDRNWWESTTSPDNKYKASIESNNIVLQPSEGASRALTTDGTDAMPYERFFWSPNSKQVVAYRIERGDRKPVYRIESSPRNNGKGGGVGRSILHTDEYTLPGDKLDSFELNLFDADSGHQIKPEVERIDSSEWSSHPSPAVRWRADGKRFLLEKHDRGHQRMRIIEVDATNGAARTVLDEKSETFIWTAHTEALDLQLVNYLKNDKEMIYVSERSGWRQMYLLDLDSGELKPITQGDWVLRGINQIDEEKREIWFSASGVYPTQDPYLVHYGRVRFDGTGLIWLTQSNGNHVLDFGSESQAWSSDGAYFVVTHSLVNSPPVSELHRSSDGGLVMTLEKAEVGEGWNPPEPFVAKGRDGKTDIFGIICRPADFDPAKSYPIIESVYAGPQSAYVPKSFGPNSRFDYLTSMGFIVVQVDGMGTALRSKAFHDVCWRNLADAGFPDRIEWIKSAAQKYPYMDITRVGIFGTSAGGQSAAGALLFHNDIYKVAVANCGCHDNRMDKSSWNEQWMGYPIGPQYAACSNIDNADKLKGRLQLVLGEMDDNVPVDSTYRFIDALVQNGKEFEFVLIPGAGHGAPSPITRRKMQDFFLRYLKGVEPACPN